MSTYQSALNDLRARLDEISISHFWTDANLLNWLVRGCVDIARRSETLIEYNTTINAVALQADYVLPSDVLRIHRLEYIPQTTANPPQVYPLQLSSYYEMDQRWGANQFIPSVYPSWAVLRGTPGNPLNRGSGVLVFKVYPVPSQAGQFNLFYYAMPNLTPAATDNLAVRAGWEDLPVEYAASIALQADRDPRWQEFRQLYETDLATMIEMTRHDHDQGQQMSWATSGQGYDGGYGYGYGYGAGF